MDAVQSKEVYVVNANAYFSKPGPRIVVGLEILAKIIDPEAFGKLKSTFEFVYEIHPVNSIDRYLQVHH